MTRCCTSMPNLGEFYDNLFDMLVGLVFCQLNADDARKKSFQ